MIKIAFIMLCHTAPEQTKKLISKLSEFSDSDVYIHVDLNHSEVREWILGNAHILPVEKSFRITWGGINIVKATLELIREVQESGKKYDYLWLISGQDYPIVSIPEIERRLEEQKGMNYIDIIPPGNHSYKWYKKLYEIRYPVWINRDKVIIRLYKRVYKIITGGYCHSFSLFIKENPFDFDLIIGSQWWTLTSDAAFEILQYSDEHQNILEYYENTIIPDESFFQMMFMKGSFRNFRKDSLTFCYVGSNRRHPKVLTEEDKVKIIEARDRFCFARKFDQSSQKLIQQIENSIEEQ